MAKSFEARSETLHSPKELVDAAVAAKDAFLQSTVFNRGKNHFEYYKTLAEAYTAVTQNPELNAKYNWLVDHVAQAMPSVQRDSRNAEGERRQYQIIFPENPVHLQRKLQFEAALSAVQGMRPESDITELELDILYLLQEAVSPTRWGGVEL